ncbi:MAG: hypothetical protein WC784_04875 [Candidatus Shapirobacteria bacterium]|jgi:hypothetical protein
MTDDSGRLNFLLEMKRNGNKLTHAEERELKKLQKAKKSHCMCMGLSKPVVVHGGKK